MLLIVIMKTIYLGAILCASLSLQAPAAKTSSSYSIGIFDIAVTGIDITVRNDHNEIVWATEPTISFLRLGICTCLSVCLSVSIVPSLSYCNLPHSDTHNYLSR